MKMCRFFLLGIFAAGILGGSWWIVIVSGLLSLFLKRSYFVLVAAVVLDISFASGGATQFYGAFYTALFFSTTLVVEYIRKRLLWGS
ncbi:MAG: hypothetical protein JKX80_01540 [Candidatus Pacebacteria bacterium]|nr:hypothetical protein [Candidatus Paceibacterota bacterium]